MSIRFVAVGLAVLSAVPVATSCSTAPAVQHGTITTLSAASSPDSARCHHRVPQEVCTRCNPALVSKFKAARDWCAEHGVPESQCFRCHPDLTFDPLPPLPAGADLREIAGAGEDVPDLGVHAVPGKITLFDFYAVWCAPCRQIDAHLFPLLGRRHDMALRKLNVVDWETPLARRYLREVPTLPFVMVFDRRGKHVASVAGLDLPALDRAIERAGAR